MNDVGLGFFGGILGGLLLGYVGLWGCQRFRCTQDRKGLLLGYVVIGGISFALSYLVLRFVVATPLLWAMDHLIEWVQGIDPTRTTVLVGVLALFTVMDLGGPFNKVAFTVVLESYANGWYHISGPAIVSVVIPPLSMLVWTLVRGYRVRPPEDKGKRLLVLGSLFGLTESAIPMVLEDPLRRWPAMVIGSVAASVFASHMGMTNILMMVSLPGLFGVNKIGVYLLAHLIGVAIVVGLLLVLPAKKTLHSTKTTV
jgi:fructose-specific phosphotransferase system IIC component